MRFRKSRYATTGFGLLDEILYWRRITVSLKLMGEATRWIQKN
nr:MAG TPA: hypothetical protein [Caudoviricetes sp.]